MIQTRVDNQNFPFIRGGNGYDKEPVTIEQDAGRSTDLLAFTVLGKKVSSVATSGTADAGNTGDGTCTSVAQLGPDAAQVGSYNLECTTKIATGGVFKLEGPNGELLASGLTITLTVATVFNAGGLTFILTPGATDFEVGDKFAIVSSAVNKYVPLDPAAVDGSQYFAGIYTQFDIPSATLVAGDYDDAKVLIGGDKVLLDADQIVLENSVTLSTVLQNGKTLEENMNEVGIWTTDTIDIDELENV